MTYRIAALAAALGLAACQSPDRTTTLYYDQYNRPLPKPLYLTHSGADANGTPLITSLDQFNPIAYRYEHIHGGVGEDYFAGFVRGGLAGAFEGAGIAGFGALLRPAKTVFNNVGNSSATGGRAAATGGSTSLNASLSNSQRQTQRQIQQQHQSATATSDAAAHSTSSSSSTGGNPLFPNGTTLHTPNGDIVVDPTVTVRQ